MKLRRVCTLQQSYMIYYRTRTSLRDCLRSPFSSLVLQTTKLNDLSIENYEAFYAAVAVIIMILMTELLSLYASLCGGACVRACLP